MTLTLDDLKNLFAIGLPIVSILFTIVATRRKDLDGRFDEIDARLKAGSDRMDRHESRLSRTEQTIQAMPGKDDVHNLQLMLADMRGDMKAMTEHMAGMAGSLSRTESIVSRHEDHLREKH